MQSIQDNPITAQLFLHLHLVFVRFSYCYYKIHVSLVFASNHNLQYHREAVALFVYLCSHR